MNKRPILYMQTDPRWAGLPYQTHDEKTTIGASGCGPTCAAMLIETLTGKTFTPVDACKWSVDHGYKATGQGTYYSYFVPQFGVHGIKCERINGASVYGFANAAAHKDAFELLKEGWYLIACMGKGLWTRSGHYVVVWERDGLIHINDPASTAAERVAGDPDLFFKQVKYYWAIDAREYNREEEDDDMATVERFEELWLEYRKKLQDNDSSDYSAEAREWAKRTGIVKGGSDAEFNGMWEDVLTREQMVTLLYRFGQSCGLL